MMSTATALTTVTQRRWPAEYERHYGCIILFPKPSKQTAYCGASHPTVLVNAQNAVLDVVSAIVRHGQEDVYLFCDSHDANHQSTVIAYLQQRKLPYVVTFDHPMARDKCAAPGTYDTTTAAVHLMICPSEDTWARDTGPTFVVEEKFNTEATMDDLHVHKSRIGTTSLIGLDWEFNAYGGKEDGCYWPYELDQQIAFNMIQSINHNCKWDATTIIQHEKIVSLILEGGSIHTDGETILTTKECLLHSHRNPGLSQSEIELLILRATGCTKMIWLNHGLAYDNDTNGHIDNWACFVKPGHIVLAWTDDLEHDPINYRNCRESYTILQNSTDAHNRSFHIHKLYLPSPPIYYINPGRGPSVFDAAGLGKGEQVDEESNIATTVKRVTGTQMAASYVNFYIANEAVIVPQFGNPNDQQAIELLRSIFSSDQSDPYVDDIKDFRTKKRVVVGIPSSYHILYGGGNIHCITQQIPMI